MVASAGAMTFFKTETIRVATRTRMRGKGRKEEVGQRKVKRLQDKALEGQRAEQKRAQGKQWRLEGQRTAAALSVVTVC
jgi:hypothetical protein